MNGRICWIGVALVLVLWTAQTWAGEDFNYVTNGGFEVVSTEDPAIPAGWFPFFSKNKTIELSQAGPKSGNNCLKMSVQGVRGATMGIAQVIPVEDGTTYSFSVYVKNNNENPLGKEAHGMIGIEWKDSDGKEISRTSSPEWDMSLSRMRWESRNVTEKAPRDAKTAAMVISFYDGEKGGVGSCWVDEARVELKK